MNKKQIFSLIIGLLFLVAGIFFLVRMTQVENPNSLAEVFDFSKKETTAAVGEENEAVESAAASEETKGEEEKSGLTRMIEWIVSKDIPLWIYLTFFVGIIILVRGYGIYREYKAYKNAKK